MRSRNHLMRIRDILYAAKKIIAHTEQLNFEAFSANEWTVDAVLRNFTIIGEAASHLTESFTSAHPEVPWADMRDMRNIVVHEYFGVDLSVVWNTIRNDLPVLIPMLEAILEEEQNQ